MSKSESFDFDDTIEDHDSSKNVKSKPKISTRKMNLLLLQMLSSVVAYNIINKVQNVQESATGRVFDHPYLQAAISSVGHLIGFVHYKILLIKNKASDEGKKFPKKLIWIPSFLDLFEHVTRNVAVTLIAASAAQMLKSTSVVFAALLSVFYLKNKLYRHHFSAIFLIIVGTGLVGFALVIEGGDNNKSKSLITGIILMLIG
jgi:hypothetical protein